MTKPTIAIIGGGVAGLTAAVYALRANADVTIFEKQGLGGLTATIDKIENFPTYSTVNGFDLTQSLSKQVLDLGAKVVYQQVLDVAKENDDFVVTTNKQKYLFDAVIVATGTKHGKLGIESNYVGKGVSYCATCDGNFYRNADVAVVGNTNTAVKEVLYLAGLCKTVYLVSDGNLDAEEINVAQAKANSNVVFVDGVVVELIDYEYNTRTNLLFREYTVNLPAGTNDTRFALSVKPDKTATSMENITTPSDGELRKFIIDGVLYLQKDGVLYDAQGKLVR